MLWKQCHLLFARQSTFAWHLKKLTLGENILDCSDAKVYESSTKKEKSFCGLGIYFIFKYLSVFFFYFLCVKDT